MGQAVSRCSVPSDAYFSWFFSRLPKFWQEFSLKFTRGTQFGDFRRGIEKFACFIWQDLPHCCGGSCCGQSFSTALHHTTPQCTTPHHTPCHPAPHHTTPRRPPTPSLGFGSTTCRCWRPCVALLLQWMLEPRRRAWPWRVSLSGPGVYQAPCRFRGKGRWKSPAHGGPQALGKAPCSGGALPTLSSGQGHIPLVVGKHAVPGHRSGGPTSVLLLPDTNSVARPVDRSQPCGEDIGYRTFLQAFNIRALADVHVAPPPRHLLLLPRRRQPYLHGTPTPPWWWPPTTTGLAPYSRTTTSPC